MLTFIQFITESNKRTNRRAWKAVPGDSEIAPFYAGKKMFFNRRQRNAEKFSKSNPTGHGSDEARSRYYGKDSKQRSAVRGERPYIGSRVKPSKSK
jgi:ribosomal protein L31